MKKKTRVPSAQELKTHFMEIAWPIVDSYVGAALGTKELQSTNAGCREEVWELVKKLMLQSSDKLQLTVSNPRDILEAVGSGQCTIEEAQQLLTMMKQVSDIENPGVGASGGSALNVYIQTAAENKGEERALELSEGVDLIE